MACNCVLTDVEGLSSLDFRALFLLCSGIFSGAPASRATPEQVREKERKKEGKVIHQGIKKRER